MCFAFKTVLFTLCSPTTTSLRSSDRSVILTFTSAKFKLHNVAEFYDICRFERSGVLVRCVSADDSSFFKRFEPDFDQTQPSSILCNFQQLQGLFSQPEALLRPQPPYREVPTRTLETRPCQLQTP
ncbi:hypothetical protein L596_024301 [Steinernema carpocapsae]|uniref:Uncharacterized protein n=1 Tax=Steinernema carpocapsae TaxID=34508 RepID=A0A4U5MGD7_STECR|nr:hypothetical protein L596_024301 [Steinernema carpocapsae]